MKYEKKEIALIDNKSVYQIDIRNNAGMEISVLSYGATLASVKVPSKNGPAEEITLGFDNLPGWQGDHPYFNATIGRFANRIADGHFTLEGVDYSLAVNNGPNHLHGGIIGFNKQIWDVQVVENDDEISVFLSLTSPDGQEGYPGTLSVVTGYTLGENNELTLSYSGTTDKTTIINLTNHTYWNLDSPGNDVLDHGFITTAQKYLPKSSVGIPSGEISSVEGTPFDFTREKKLGTNIEEIDFGYDHCFVLPEKEGIQLLGSMESERSGRKMTLYTDQPGFQLYTASYLEGIKIRNNVKAEQYGAFCIETQNFPDAPNKPQFPSPVLKPGETYIHTTSIKFEW